MKKKAQEEAKALLVKKQAEAKANTLLVRAGLTPIERATIAKETAIGVAEKMAQVKFPELLIIGGNDNGATLDPFSAVGLESFMRISKQLAKTTK